MPVEGPRRRRGLRRAATSASEAAGRLDPHDRSGHPVHGRAEGRSPPPASAPRPAPRRQRSPPPAQRRRRRSLPGSSRMACPPRSWPPPHRRAAGRGRTPRSRRRGSPSSRTGSPGATAPSARRTAARDATARPSHGDHEVVGREPRPARPPIRAASTRRTAASCRADRARARRPSSAGSNGARPRRAAATVPRTPARIAAQPRANSSDGQGVVEPDAARRGRGVPCRACRRDRPCRVDQRTAGRAGIVGRAVEDVDVAAVGRLVGSAAGLERHDARRSRRAAR